jgi:hypothetical protein
MKNIADKESIVFDSFYNQAEEIITFVPFYYQV